MDLSRAWANTAVLHCGFWSAGSWSISAAARACPHRQVVAVPASCRAHLGPWISTPRPALFAQMMVQRVLLTSVLPPAGTQMRGAEFHQEKHPAVHGERAQVSPVTVEEPAGAGSVGCQPTPSVQLCPLLELSRAAPSHLFNKKRCYRRHTPLTKSVFKNLRNPVEAHCSLRVRG